jgi:hypothetical protein
MTANKSNFTYMKKALLNATSGKCTNAIFGTDWINKRKESWLLAALLFVFANAQSQFHTPTVNATLGANEYGTGNVNNLVTGSSTWYLTWNDTDLFVFLQNANETEPVTIYLDVDPSIPVNGGSNANGTLVGLNYDGYTTRPNLPFRADIAIYCHSGYRELFRRDGSNGWFSLGGGNDGISGSGTNDYTGNTNGQYSSNNAGDGSGGNDRREFRISWSRLLGSINSGIRPSSFNWLGYVSYNNGMYAQVPIENYNGNNVNGNSNGIVRYFTVSNTNNGAATGPFSRNSFTQPLGATNNTFGPISVWDFTMNSTGQQIARSNAGGNWNIGGTLTVGAGTLFFGSGGSGYGTSTVANVNIVGGTLNMDQTNKTLNVSGNLSINTGATLSLSGTIGGDLDIQGNIIDNGTFNANSRAVFFSGGNVQDIQGNGIFDIPFVRINKTGGRVRLQSDLTCIGVNAQNAIEIQGVNSILDLNGRTLNLGATDNSSTYNNNITTPGFIRGSASSTLTILGTGTLGTINFDQSVPGSTNALGNLNLDRTSGGVVTVGNSFTINTSLTVGSASVLDIKETLTDNRTTKTFGGTVQYSGIDQAVIGGTYNNLSFLNSGTKTFGGASSIAGNFVVTTATGIAPSTITFNGASSQNIAGLAYNNIEFSEAGSKTFTSNASVNSVSSIRFSGAGATIDFDGASNNVVFELKSNIDGTASVANASGWTLNGKVTTERYIPANRAWRILTAPLTGVSDNTITDNWQGTNGEGVLLFSPTATAQNGYVSGGTSPNIRKYATSWQNIADLTTEPMFGATATDTKPFLVFVTGPSNSTNIVTGADATTLRPKGQLITGPVNHTGLATGVYHALANPYASAINPVSLITNNTGQKLWLINPSLGNFGAYVTFDGQNWSVPVDAQDAFIQSGQGFFVRSATATSFQINEFDKVSGSSNNWFAKNAAGSTTTDADKIRVLLYKQIENNWKLADGALSVNYADGSNEVNAMDSNKISNFNESIMFRNNTASLSIEHRALPVATEIQPIRLTGTTALPYQLRVRTENYSNSTLLPVLEDTVAGTFTTIPTDGSEVVIPFTGVAATTTNPDNRFRIVYQVNLNNVEQSPLVASVFPNPVTNNQLHIHLGSNNQTANYTVTNLLGQFIQKGTLANTQNVITLSSVSQGFYLLNITQDGKSFTTKIYVQ